MTLTGRVPSKAARQASVECELGGMGFVSWIA